MDMQGLKWFWRLFAEAKKEQMGSNFTKKVKVYMVCRCLQIDINHFKINQFNKLTIYSWIKQGITNIFTMWILIVTFWLSIVIEKQSEIFKFGAMKGLNFRMRLLIMNHSATRAEVSWRGDEV